MFNKPIKIKQNSPLKASERRKMSSEILKTFPQLKEDELLDLILQKDTVSFTKLITYSGESVIVYSVQKLPIFFVLENVFYPTVYMLWKFPSLLPTFTTWSQVLPKLRSGADLMLPGVVLNEGAHMHAYGNLEKGARVAINVTTNKAPVSVGVTALSSFDMYMAANKGKAVKIHHIAGDHLWALGSMLTIPDMGPPADYKVEVVQCIRGETIASAINQPQAKTECEIHESEAYGNTPDTEMLNVNIEKLEENNETITVDTPGAGTDDIKKEMDELLLCCFLKAWKTSAKKVECPILTSNFYRLHILPACPYGKSIDLKKSSYKKVSKFLGAMEDKGIIKLKEMSKGVESIISVDYGHSLLKEFVDKYPTTQTPSQNADISPKYSKPEIVEMRTVSAAVLPLLSYYDHKKGEHLRVTDVRKKVTEYVKNNNLQSSSDKSRIILDPLLKMVLQCPDTNSLKWGDLMAKFLDQMSNSYQISFAGESPITSKGKLKTIDIQVERRGNDKKVTLVNNLELYNINVQEFSKQCQLGAAASSSVNTVTRLKSRQVLIQGNQVLLVANLLIEKYKIPKQHITGLQHAPKSKK